MPKKRAIPTEYRGQRQRAKGDKKPPFQFQDRDFRMLQAIHANRFLTRDLLQPFFPPQLDRTPRQLRTKASGKSGTNLDRRLSKLFHHGYVDRIRTVLGGELIYALAQRGADLISKEQPDFPVIGNWEEKNRDLSNNYIDHALMIARFRAALTVALDSASGISLKDFFREVHLPVKPSHPDRKHLVSPDAFFILEARGKTAAFFLEADRSTMPLDRMFKKYERYLDMYQRRLHTKYFSTLDKHGKREGIKSFEVLTVTPSPERAASLLGLLAEDIPRSKRDMFSVAPEDIYSEQLYNIRRQKTQRVLKDTTDILAESWRSASDPANFSAIIPSPLKKIRVKKTVASSSKR